ncbi:MAG: hypothetical protein Q7S77_02435 [Candidatus Staskawiczbacteria bacterium]|nr:hypothetical protein [Candidatus Staskawiczbacteria bacterium]
MSETKLELSDLKRSLEELKIELPTDFSGSTESTVDEIYAMTKKIESGVADSLGWLASKEAYIASIEDHMKRRIAIGEWAKREDEVHGYLEACLTHDCPYFKVAAAMSYFKYWFSLPLNSQQDANKMLEDFLVRKLLVEDLKGHIELKFKRFRIGDFGFEKEDEEEIEKAVIAFKRNLQSFEDQRRKSEFRKEQEKADITLEELLVGKNGRCFMQVPPQPPKFEGGNWLAGGGLTVEADDRFITPISGVGKLEIQVKRMREIRVRIERHTLEWSAPPATGNKNFGRVFDWVMRNNDFTEEQAENYVNKMKALWHLIARAQKGQEAKEHLAEIKEEFRKKATISPYEIFGFTGENAKGIACLELDGPYVDGDGPAIYEFFFLLEKGEDDGENFISIKDMPSHVAELLGELSGKKFLGEENFMGVPPVLRRVLRYIKSQQELAYEISEA